MNDAQEWLDRYKRFEGTGWSLVRASYQLRNADGSAGKWMAKINVLHDTYEATTVQALMEQEPRKYDSRDFADAVAFRYGVTWLEKNAK